MDIFKNKKPIQIESDEFWFNGNIIQKQIHIRLSKWITFPDNDDEDINTVYVHATKKEAIQHALENPCTNPARFPVDYIG